MKKWSILLILCLATVVLTQVLCYGAENVIYGCYQKNNGQLRIVGGPEECRPPEKPISWNIVGPPGPQGPQGPPGPPGPPGPQGPPGPSAESDKAITSNYFEFQQPGTATITVPADKVFVITDLVFQPTGESLEFIFDIWEGDPSTGTLKASYRLSFASMSDSNRFLFHSGVAFAPGSVVSLVLGGAGGQGKVFVSGYFMPPTPAPAPVLPAPRRPRL